MTRERLMARSGHPDLNKFKFNAEYRKGIPASKCENPLEIIDSGENIFLYRVV